VAVKKVAYLYNTFRKFIYRMSDIKVLKKEHEDVKSQLKNLVKEFEVLRSNMADKADKAQAPNEADIQNLSDTCDGLMSFKMDTLTTPDNFQSKLNNLSDQVEVLSKALNDALLYSYQYYLKIVGVPQTNDRETVEVCIKIFKKIGKKVSLAYLDITHRVQPRSQNGRRKKNKPIICKFVRRMVRDQVLDARSRTNRLTTSDFGLATDYEMDRIGIFSHLDYKS